MKHIFKVKYGYAPSEYVLIETGADLERAIYARIEKIPVTLGGKFIDGKTILLIEPDVHSYTGWNRAYEPKTAEDFNQIARDVPKALDRVLEAHQLHVKRLVEGGQQSRIGLGEAMKQLQAPNQNANG